MIAVRGCSVLVVNICLPPARRVCSELILNAHIQRHGNHHKIMSPPLNKVAKWFFQREQSIYRLSEFWNSLRLRPKFRKGFCDSSIAVGWIWSDKPLAFRYALNNSMLFSHTSIIIEYYFQLYGQTSRDGVHRQFCLILHPLSHKLAIHSRNCTAIRHLPPKTASSI
jgi:hypothetical protein